MAKRNRRINELTRKRRLKQGRGIGYLSDYKPWVHIQDVASSGLATRIKGIKTKRTHHFLSNLELRCFYELDWSEKVVDIREQFPLEIEETQIIAQGLGVRHPYIPKTDLLTEMTTDFLVTVICPIGTKEVALTVKYAKDLTNRRNLEKFEIERLYWKRRNIGWGIFTERNVNLTLVKNIEWVHSCTQLWSFPSCITPKSIDLAEEFMFSRLKNNDRPLRLVTEECDIKFSFPMGVSMKIVRQLIATKFWSIDMYQPIQPDKPLFFLI